AALARWIVGIDSEGVVVAPVPVDGDFPLDPERLATLRELDGGDGELLNAVVSGFVGDSTRQLVDVSTALRQGDPGSVERTAHSLRGASANLGATTLADLCGELEALARATALGMAPDLLESIRAEHLRVCSALDVVFTET
ncbi:MAG: two-component system, sensor histidine kinase and response regulator, partial [Actinomycetota bacterium]|nr:two-component system, sensor histidine kinase and response regulator [Actinomycetota bacterium]